MDDLFLQNNISLSGPPVPNDETFQAEGGFKIGEPATLLIPFHAYPQPER